MDTDHIAAFLAIAQCGGFARASRVLHLSQPAISRRIRLLEQELGAPLFERRPRGAVLTEAGTAFLPHAQATVASMRDGVAAVRAVQGGEAGAVTLALVGTLANATLTARLREFREQFPGVDLRLRTALSDEVTSLVLRGEAALGLRYGPAQNPGLTCVTADNERLVAVCRPGHRLAGAAPSQDAAAALAGEQWLIFPARTGAAGEPYAAAIHQLLAAHGLAAATMVPVDSLTAQKRMVEAGFGLAVLPESGIAEELAAGTLATLGGSALTRTIPVVLVRRRRGFASGAVQALAAMLTDGHSPGDGTV
jgi:DNA-binding transcriptional LysR family regulator